MRITWEKMSDGHPARRHEPPLLDAPHVQPFAWQAFTDASRLHASFSGSRRRSSRPSRSWPSTATSRRVGRCCDATRPRPGRGLARAGSVPADVQMGQRPGRAGTGGGGQHAGVRRHVAPAAMCIPSCARSNCCVCGCFTHRVVVASSQGVEQPEGGWVGELKVSPLSSSLSSLWLADSVGWSGEFSLSLRALGGWEEFSLLSESLSDGAADGSDRPGPLGGSALERRERVDQGGEIEFRFCDGLQNFRFSYFPATSTCPRLEGIFAEWHAWFEKTRECADVVPDEGCAVAYQESLWERLERYK